MKKRKMAEEEKIIAIQTSGREEGEPELIEEILQSYYPIIYRLARSQGVRNCRLDPEDVEQQLFIRLFHAIEFWPQRGKFRNYAIQTLRNTLKNIMSQAHSGSTKISFLSVPLDEPDLKDKLVVDPIPQIDQQIEVQTLLDQFVEFLKTHRQTQLAKAVNLLRKGHGMDFTAVFLNLEETELNKNLRYWGNIFLKERKWPL